MLGAFFHCRRNGKQFVFRHVRQSQNVRHARLAFGEGTRLVKNCGVNLRKALHCRGALEQQTVFCSLTRADHNGNGSCKTERAGAGDDKNADRKIQRKTEIL